MADSTIRYQAGVGFGRGFAGDNSEWQLSAFPAEFTFILQDEVGGPYLRVTPEYQLSHTGDELRHTFRGRAGFGWVHGGFMSGGIDLKAGATLEGEPSLGVELNIIDYTRMIIPGFYLSYETVLGDSGLQFMSVGLRWAPLLRPVKEVDDS